MLKVLMLLVGKGLGEVTGVVEVEGIRGDGTWREKRHAGSWGGGNGSADRGGGEWGGD